jgi:S-adenosylmethionine hydrolase
LKQNIARFFQLFLPDNEVSCMAIVTLLTDLGYRDPYLAMAKGKLLSGAKDVQVVDTSHDPSVTGDDMIASFMLRNVVPQFPKGSIHVISVNTTLEFGSRHVVFEHKGHYFVGADSGIFYMFLGEHPERVYDITGYSKSFTTFPLMDIFIPVVVDIIHGKKLEEIGATEIKLVEKTMFHPTVEPNRIVGSILYIDVHGNLITNITKNLFEKIRNGRRFKIYVRSATYAVAKISNNYNEVIEGELVALINYSGLIEIAMHNANCAKMLGVEVRSSMVVEFNDL